jgi:hypothetical protein
LLQQARALQRTEAFDEYRKRRQVAEHRLARLVYLGVRQARYFGRAKTCFQLLLAATVANLTLVAAKLGMLGKASNQAASLFVAFHHGFVVIITALVVNLSTVIATLLASLTDKLCSAEWGFRPDF